MKQIIILGAGISGLATAFYLRKYVQEEIKITLIEKSDRVGGWIATSKKGGFLFEKGPFSFLSKGKGKETLHLIENLQKKDLLIAADREAKRKYLYTQGKLEPLTPLFFLKNKMLQACIKEWRTPLTAKNDESIGEFFTRRFNKEIAELFIDPMIRGIFGGDPMTLSCRTFFPQLYEWERRYESVTKGFFLNRERQKAELFTLKEGMESLPRILAEQSGAEIFLNAPVKKISLHSDHIALETPQKRWEADHLIAAIPSYSLRPLLPTLSLPKIPFLSLTKVSFGFTKFLLKKKGVGYLIPKREGEKILGMTWESALFPQLNRGTTLSIMIAGEKERKEALFLARKACYDHMHIDEDPEITQVHIAKEAIPQYPVGYTPPSSLPRLSLLGDRLGINDCIHQAHTFCKNFVI